MKTNAEISHDWAHADYHHSGLSGNLSYQGYDLYSYSTMVGSKVQTKEGIVFLLTNRHYSPTTSRHLTLARNAAYGSTIEVDDVTADCMEAHRSNHDVMKDNLKVLEASYNRARSNKSFVANDITVHISKMNSYNKLFGLRRKDISMPKSVRVTTAPTGVEKIMRFRKYKRRSLHDMDMTYLRVSKDGTKVETSKGMRISVKECEVWWKFIKSTVISGKEFIGKGQTISGYCVDFISCEGVLKVGCHIIQYEESKLIAEHFRWSIL